MVNKKAYVKTLEALIAIVIFLIFITAILVINREPERQTIPDDVKLLQTTIFNKFQTESGLRTCLSLKDMDCANNTIRPLIPSTMNYNFDICIELNPSSCTTKTFPVNMTIYSDSLMIQEEEQPAILYLFLWRKV